MLLKSSWTQLLRPCRDNGIDACDQLSVTAWHFISETMPRFMKAFQKGSEVEWYVNMNGVQQAMIFLAVLESATVLEQSAELIASTMISIVSSPGEDKDPDPCYCGHGLGMHTAFKTDFLHQIASPNLQARLSSPDSRARTLVQSQSCADAMEGAKWPIQYVVESFTGSSCFPSQLAFLLLCAQQQLLKGDAVLALGFAVAAYIGASFVPQCLKGTRSGSRSSWPFTLLDVAAHVRGLLDVVARGGDLLEAVWSSSAAEAPADTRPVSPCLGELSPACIISGALVGPANHVRYCDEEGLHTVNVFPLANIEHQLEHETGWLLPVSSLHNPYHSLLWAVAALDIAMRFGRVDVVLLWPTNWAIEELAKGLPTPFRELADLLGLEVRLAAAKDECFTTLRVGRGHILDATVHALPARPRHFTALAAAVGARIRHLEQAREQVLFVQRHPLLGRYVEAMAVAAESVRAHGIQVHLLEEALPYASPPEPLHQIVRLQCSSTRVLVAAHGGALAFLAFLPSLGSAAIELSPPGWREHCIRGWDRNPFSLYGQLAAAAGMRHLCLMGSPAGIFSEEIRFGELYNTGNVSVPADTITEAVSEGLYHSRGWGQSAAWCREG